MAKNTKTDTQKLSFDKQLILSNYISLQFGYNNIDELFSLIKDDHKYDELEPDGHTKYYSELCIVIADKQLKDKISEYDYNIVSHLEYINKERLIKIKLKYYQYLYLLFVEYYLDMYFNNKDELLAELNDFVDRFYNDGYHGIQERRVIWDISVIAYMINKKWFTSEDISCPNIKKDTSYEITTNNHKITMVNYIDVDKVYSDLFKKLGE